MIEKFSHLLLRSIAYFILEPRFKNGKWLISKDSLQCLSLNLDSLLVAYNEALKIFHQLNLCSTCSGYCCYGAYNRLSVYDHIAHKVAGLKDSPAWGYRLHPIRANTLNRIDEGKCPFFIAGKGCALEYRKRPALCIWWICNKMKISLNDNEKYLLKKIRRKIDKVHWAFARCLLLGGMSRLK